MTNYRKDVHNSDVPKLCLACEARHRGICGAMTASEMLTLSRYSSIKTYPAGSLLVTETDDVTGYANILKGVVKLSKMMEDGRQQIVGLQFAPDFLGRPFHERSQITAEAASEVTLCQFPKDAFERLLTDAPALETKLHRQTLKELDGAREWMLTLGRRTAVEKVAAFLLVLALYRNPYEVVEDEDVRQIEVPLSRAEIADFLGLTVETVSRQITRLKKQNIISEVQNRSLLIPSVSVLAKTAGN